MLEHEYTVLGGMNRARIGQYLAIISSLVSATIVFALLSAIDIAKHFGVASSLPPSVLSLTGAGTVFLALYWLLNRYVWKWRSMTVLLGVPDLTGDWSCKGKTINPDKSIRLEWDAQITIVQSFDRIRVRLKTEKSGSNSTSAALIYDAADGFRLFYSYKNDPKINETELSAHRGFAEITFAKDLKTGEGEYFNGYGRYTFGLMSLKRV